jgi:WD40 repeat protein
MITFGAGTAAVASDPAEHQVNSPHQQSKLAAQGKSVKAEGILPEGAIARLGDARLRHAAPAMCITFSPDSRSIISGGQDEYLRVWDVQTGVGIRSVKVPYIPAAIRFTRGGTCLAVAAGNSSPVRLLHPGTLQEMSSLGTGITSQIAVSEDGKLSATVSSENVLTVSEVDSRLPRLEIPLENPDGYRFAFHADGKSIAVADRAGKVTLFKIAGGKPLLSLDHGGPIDGLAVSGDGCRLATGGEGPDGSLKIWEFDRYGNEKERKPLQ